jgi:phosphocarrier protein HPr
MNEAAPGAEGEVARASGSVVLTHREGLHARPSLALTKLAKKFPSQIHIGATAAGPWIDAKSIAKVMKMKAPKDTVLYFEAAGDGAGDAVRALIELIEKDFVA